MTFPSLDDTLALIQKAHAGQRYNDWPYWHHPVRVMMRLGPGATDEERKAALLHDVVEDTGYTRDQLKEMGYSWEVIDIVDLVTKLPGLSYTQNIQRIIDAGNLSAIKVKLADNGENDCPENRAWLEPARAASLARRYRKARAMMLAAYPAMEEVVRFGDLPGEEVERWLHRARMAVRHGETSAAPGR